MRRHVPLIVALLSLGCGNEPSSPTSLTSTLDPPAAPAVMMRGEVRDTVNLPISGAEVQVVAPGGAAAVTDANGEFVLPWPFSGTVIVRVAKEGFHARERPVPEPGSPRRPVFLRFDLEAVDTPIIVGGMYRMTLTAADECTQLPNVARQRTYRSQVYSTSKVGSFSVELLDADFPFSGFVSSEVREGPTRTLRLHIVTEPDWGNPGTTLIERIGPEMILEVTGSADLPLGAHSAAAPFDGTIAFCAAEPPSKVQAFRCPVQPATCRSANHRLAWVRQ